VNVRNVHERRLEASPTEVGELIDDPKRMWPRDRWPGLRQNGIGFLRHEPLERVAGERLTFRITGPGGFSGWHGWDVEQENGHTVLRHTVEADATGWTRLAWPAVIRPMHDALHEDVLDAAERAVGAERPARPFSRRVRVLRWAIGKSRSARR
jgi:hypothetical protein